MDQLEKLILLKQDAAYQETPPGASEPAFKAHARKKQCSASMALFLWSHSLHQDIISARFIEAIY